ncbi:hypothetical protein [Streptomyces sp. NBC_00347]|uniref:hypothetical protein n=1 Tax=Streptomyces sp. NBC_00347 TaxID=2975721 RepID=UPI002252D1C1|nr:hypothetical protein [Streptomyces sp. NBC_00347]MCX5123310.1 hypothetical protein [Streptomyces sp. NBC_00347]
MARVELRGRQSDFELFETELETCGWPVLERPPALQPGGPYGCVVEVRFPGGRYRAPDAAREHLEALADRLLLDLTVLAVQVLRRDSVKWPLWHVYRELPPVPPEVAATRRGRIREQLRKWAAVRLGTRDTGGQVQAPDADAALAAATAALPGAPTPTGVTVRSAGDRRAVDAGGHPGRQGPTRRLVPLRYPLLAALGCGVAAARSPGHWHWLPTGLFLLAVIAATVRQAPLEGRPGRWVGFGSGGLLSTAVAFGLAAMAAAPRGSGGPGEVVIVLVACFLTARGLWLLARQSTWGRLVPWLAPALLTLAPVLLAGLGVSLQALYLYPFGLDAEDVDVPAVMRVLATGRVLAASLLWLIAPAVLGYLRHLHIMIALRWLGYATFVYASVITLSVGVVFLAGFPALSAGFEARAAAAEGRTPGPYFGIKPEWVCALPTKPLAQVPSDGGLLDPARPYLSLGDAGGTAALWDAKEKQAIKVPLSALRLVPVDDPRGPCP